MKTAISALLCAALLACGGSKSTEADEPTTTSIEPEAEAVAVEGESGPAPTGEMSLEESKKVILRVAEMMNTLASAAAAGEGDCEKVAAGVRTWAEANSAELKQLEVKGEQIPESQQQELVDEAMEIQKASGALMQAVGECGNNPAMQEALKSL